MMEGKIENLKYKVLIEKENKLIGRKEIYLIIESNKTPSREEVKELVSKVYKVDKKYIIIRKIRGYFGLPKFLVEGHIYNNENNLKYFEPLYILKRNNLENGKEKENS